MNKKLKQWLGCGLLPIVVVASLVVVGFFFYKPYPPAKALAESAEVVFRS